MCVCIECVEEKWKEKNQSKEMSIVWTGVRRTRKCELSMVFDGKSQMLMWSESVSYCRIRQPVTLTKRQVCFSFKMSFSERKIEWKNSKKTKAKKNTKKGSNKKETLTVVTLIVNPFFTLLWNHYFQSHQLWELQSILSLKKNQNFWPENHCDLSNVYR